MSSTVLIAESDHLDSLKTRHEYSEALAFLDTDTPRALEAIIRHKPEVVAIERAFAAKSRGVALINRIKADATLSTCELRIVAPDGSYAKVTPRRAVKPATTSEIGRAHV